MMSKHNIIEADRRALAPLFQARLKKLIARSGLSKAQFAAKVGIDRTALSQLLSTNDVRLPRAETLVALALSEGASLDWLLGLSMEDITATEMAPGLEIEEASYGTEDPRLLEWRKEAQGSKIRYVPALLPDLLRLPEVTAYEYSHPEPDRVSARMVVDQKTLELNRRSETDMEVCMPWQRLEALAQGSGLYKTLPIALRQAQLEHMAGLIQELYPSFRLFLYDERTVFAAPFTVFGVQRAAVYLGGMYLVLNARAHIQALIQHFDHLIRSSGISDRDSVSFIQDLF